MNVTAPLPSLGLDRIQRAQPLDTAVRPDASVEERQAITANPGRVGTSEAVGLPGQSRSGLGDTARENLFRSTIKSDAEPTADTDAESGANPSTASGEKLTEEEQGQVRELQARDTEVRRHEEAHARVGGQYAGQPSYTFQTGPDGKRYAIGGEVPIDVSTVPDDPQATIAKMDVVIAAALAPAEPSGQDRKVAAQAARQRLEATADLAEQRTEQFNETRPDLPGALRSLDAAGRSPELDLAA